MNPYFYHGFDAVPLAHPFGFLLFLPFLIVLAAWSVIIKGYALWHAARNGQKSWFIVMLIVNSVGILELVYLIWFRADKQKIVAAPAPAPTPVAPSPEA